MVCRLEWRKAKGESRALAGNENGGPEYFTGPPSSPLGRRRSVSCVSLETATRSSPFEIRNSTFESLRLHRAVRLGAVADLKVEALRGRRVIALIVRVRIVDLHVRARILTRVQAALLELVRDLDVIEALKAERDVADRRATLRRHRTRRVVRIAAANDHVAAVFADPRLVLTALVARRHPAEERLVPRDRLLVVRDLEGNVVEPH